MKIKIDNHEITVTIHTTSATLSGANYYTIDYTMGNASLATCHCGPSHTQPNPLDMLHASREHRVEDYDHADADIHTGRGWDGKPVTWASSDKNASIWQSRGKKFAALTQRYTIREKILWALDQIVTD